MTQPATLWSIGHSTHSIEAFLDLLDHYGIETIADVRRHPGSRRLPQFGSEALQATLAERGIAYCWLPELGGRRRARPDSPNDAWRNASFRGYADHLDSEEFATGFERLLALASARRTAMMCAELLWWRCHRSLISDVLKLRGIEVIHIESERSAHPHPYTAPARRLGDRLIYASSGGEPLAERKRSPQLGLDL